MTGEEVHQKVREFIDREVVDLSKEEYAIFVEAMAADVEGWEMAIQEEKDDPPLTYHS